MLKWSPVQVDQYEEHEEGKPLSSDSMWGPFTTCQFRWLTIPVWASQGKLPFQLLRRALLILCCSLPVEKLRVLLWKSGVQHGRQKHSHWYFDSVAESDSEGDAATLYASGQELPTSCNGEVCSYFKADAKSGIDDSWYVMAAYGQHIPAKNRQENVQLGHLQHTAIQSENN